MDSTDKTGLARRVAKMAKSRQSFGYRAKKKFLEKVVARTVFRPGQGGRPLARPQVEKRAALLAAKLPGFKGGVLDVRL
ncbi:MAG: hypothetical protein KJ621_13845 [Proteobacteria bacterium]|nr:hypothetical protein [Pseudomonadota bacterium]MBU1741164.1 hypothetical protein [Pseudomonadota bacterium]